METNCGPITNKTQSLDNFPDEILLKIISYFSPEDICLTISKVCQRWNRLSWDNTLWKSLTYNCDDVTDFNTMILVLSEAPALKTLIMHSRHDASLLLKLLINDGCEGIKRLILRFCTLGTDSTGLLEKIVAFYPDLEVLSLEGCHPLTDPGYSLIPHLEKLTDLNLSHCNGLSGNAVRGIVDKCQNLEKLSLDYVTKIFDDDVVYIIKKLGQQLTSLILDGENLTDVAYCYLHKCRKLKLLEISFCEEMTDRGLLKGIGRLPELNSLRLKRGQNLTGLALATFLNRPCMSVMVNLNLFECSNLDDNGLDGIANRCSLLRLLSLSWCWDVTDAGIQKVISQCKELRELDLLGVMRITGLEYFSLIPSHLPHLKRLNLEQCNNIYDETLKALVEAAPELEVIDYYGNNVLLLNEESGDSSNEDSDNDWMTIS